MIELSSFINIRQDLLQKTLPFTQSFWWYCNFCQISHLWHKFYWHYCDTDCEKSLLCKKKKNVRLLRLKYIWTLHTRLIQSQSLDSDHLWAPGLYDMFVSIVLCNMIHNKLSFVSLLQIQYFNFKEHADLYLYVT